MKNHELSNGEYIIVFDFCTYPVNVPEGFFVTSLLYSYRCAIKTESVVSRQQYTMEEMVKRIEYELMPKEPVTIDGGVFNRILERARERQLR